MRLANCSLSIHRALGLCLLLLLLWATTSTQARFIGKRETPNVNMGLSASGTDPDTVKLVGESVNGSEATTTVHTESLNTTSSTTAGASILVEPIQKLTATPTLPNLEIPKVSEITQGLGGTTTALRADKEELKLTTAFSTRTEEKPKPTTTTQLNADTVQSGFTEKKDSLKASTEMIAGTTSALSENKEKIELTTAIPISTEEKQKPTTPTQLDVDSVHSFTENSQGIREDKENSKASPQRNAETTTTLPEYKEDMELTTGITPIPSSTTKSTLTASTESLTSTSRSEDHARSMQFASSTESVSFISPVTPMKLRPLPMTTTTTTTTSTTRMPSGSHENAIEEVQLEKRAKFIDSDNSTNAQQLSLPNQAEVWSLAALKIVPSTTTTTTAKAITTTAITNDIETHEDKNQTLQHKEKNLLDWQHIMIMQTSQENHTEPIIRTTLDATEAATQATTWKLDAMLNTQNEMETSASTVNKVEQSTTAAVRPQEETVTATTARTTEAKPELTDSQEETTTMSVKPIAALTDLPKLNLTADEVAVKESVKAITESVKAVTGSVKGVTESVKAVTESVIAVTETVIAITESVVTATTATPAELEIPAITNTTTSTTPTSITNELAMKTTAHEHNENSDKANDVDGSESESETDDVINVSVSQSVSSTSETTLAAKESQPITVSMRTAGDVNTTSTPTLTSTPPTLHARVNEQLAASTTTETIPTTTTILATPTTSTQIVQISNEVNLETITVNKNVTNDNSNNNNELTSVDNNLLITTTTSTEKPNNSAVIDSTANIPITIATTTTLSPLLTDENANREQETSLETNNISETITRIAVPTTTTTEATAAVKAFDESKPTTITVTAATTTTTVTAATSTIRTETAAKTDSELFEEENENAEDEQQQQLEHDRDVEETLLNKTNMASTTTSSTTTTSTTTTGAPKTTTTTISTTTEEPFISLLDDSTTTTTSYTTTTTTTTAIPTTRTTTQAEPIYSSTTDNNNNMLPVESTTLKSVATPTDLPTTMIMPNEVLDHMQQPHGNTGTDVNVIIAITVSVIGVVALILLVAFLYLMRKRQKQMSYGQRCRPVSLDAYSLDNVSVLGSVRRKGRDLRASKRTYGNAAFDDPSLRHNLLSATELAKFLERRSSIFEEFRDVPQIIARADEVPAGCEDKNRYANVIPLPETRVVLQRQGDDDKTEYINANYVRGPRDAPNYYIACQAPLESTTGDFWRMIWEQQSRVIVQATDLNENGIERCAEYLPPSVTLDNHSSYGDYQVTLKHREVKDKYAISTLMLKRVDGDECRELTHYWYKWPEAGVPLEEAPIIAMLLEARSSLKSYALEQANELKEKSSTLTLKSVETPLDQNGETKKPKPDDEGSTSSGANNEINGNVANNNKQQVRSQQGPLTIHCSPGTGRTGTIIACDMAIRSLETPKRSVDIPQLVYYVRRGRASAVQTKEQYEFIYKVANMYATKITNLSNDN